MQKNYSVSRIQVYKKVNIGLISLATLLLEVLLTRIYSVILSYHFAFLVVAIAVLGLSLGALIVHLYLPDNNGRYIDMLIAKLAIIFFFWILALWVIVFNFGHEFTYAERSLYLISSYIFCSMFPFILSGIIITLMLKNNSESIGSLYGSDLLGAAAGCIAFVFFIDRIGPTGVFIIIAVLGLIVSLTTYLVNKYYIRAIMVAFIVIISISYLFIISAQGEKISQRLISLKGDNSKTVIFEKWNAHSRIRVTDEGDDNGVEKLGLRIDADAYTPIFKSTGDLSRFEFLKSDIANIVHEVRPDSRILIIGSGGGKDILSALIHDQKSVVGVEINPLINFLLIDKLKSYSGNIARHKNVKIVTGEGRAHVASSDKKYDIIQISLIDTWAASANGAYSLTENGLYTVEAFCTFLGALEGNGLLSITRWYMETSPYETMRLYVLSLESLKKCGYSREPHKNIAIINHDISKQPPEGQATMLLSPKALSSKDIEKMSKAAARYSHNILLLPDKVTSAEFNKMIAAGYVRYAEDKKINIKPTTDDSPYFFQTVSPLNVLSVFKSDHGVNAKNATATVSLMASFLIVIILSFIILIAALIKSKKNIGTIRAFYGKTLYFVCIGFGYMLIEISVMQRMGIFLGNPTYGLIVVLATLLIGSGCGSYFSGRRIVAKYGLLFLITALVLVGFLTLNINTLIHQLLLIKVAFVMAILFPLGFLMGICMPMGMTNLKGDAKKLFSWFWIVNGVASGIAPSLAIILSMSYSISVAYNIGFLCYIFAALFYLKFTKAIDRK